MTPELRMKMLIHEEKRMDYFNDCFAGRNDCLFYNVLSLCTAVQYHRCR